MSVPDNIAYHWNRTFDGESDGPDAKYDFLERMNWIVGNLQSGIADEFFDNLAEATEFDNNYDSALD